MCAIIAVVVVLIGCVSAVIQPLPSFAGKRVLFVAAHPDDIEGTAGGLVQTLSNVSYIIVTNGDKGCSAAFCQSFSVDELAATRQLEQLAAAKVLGVAAEAVTFLNYEDAMVVSTPEVQIKMDLIAAIRRIKPDVVFSWFPYPQFQLLPSAGWDDIGFHSDHQAVGRIALDAATLGAGLSRLFPQLGAAWFVPQYYFWSFTTSATHYLDVSALLSRKIDAYLAHKSQYPNASSVAYSIKNVAAMVAAQNGLSFPAETFQAYF